jgi:hypothetical protein
VASRHVAAFKRTGVAFVCCNGWLSSRLSTAQAMRQRRCGSGDQKERHEHDSEPRETDRSPPPPVNQLRPIRGEFVELTLRL